MKKNEETREAELSPQHDRIIVDEPQSFDNNNSDSPSEPGDESCANSSNNHADDDDGEADDESLGQRNGYLPETLFQDDATSNQWDTERLLSPQAAQLPPQPRWASKSSQNGRKRTGSMVSIRNINAKFDEWKREISLKYQQVHRRFRRGSQSKAIANEIYYSVFKPSRDMDPFVCPRDGLWSIASPAQANFNMIVADCVRAIERGIPPSRISQGSSGSYFVYGTDGKISGVFKPKDEEPYGPLSPKWTKWLHRNLFPCFFGRSCLIPNNAYICEAAASTLDNLLQTFIVPFTDTVCLSSPVFYYPYFDRRRYNKKGRALPDKVGSFQLFLHDYQQADEFLRKYPLPEDGRIVSRQQLRSHYTDINMDENPAFEWTPQVILQFREELEKLVILDYIMRNTDRGLDNWMIHLSWESDPEGGIKKIPLLTIGAIDSGLSWPWKHPDEWRSYPFGWLFLPLSIIGKPFTQRTRNHFLPLLTSTKWWEESSIAMREVFSRDAEFKDRMWRKQWAVMKGQAFNVVEALKDPTQGPLELARRRRMLILDDEMEVPIHPPIEDMSNAIHTPLHGDGSDSYDDNDDDSHKLSTFPALLVDPQPKSPGSSSPLPNALSSPPQERKSSVSRKSSRGSLSLEARYRELEVNRNKSSEERNESNKRRVSHITHGPGVSLWSELINEDDTDEQTGIRTVPTSNDVGFSYAECLAEQATKTVIVERIRTVKSKPPVFTWC